MLNGPAWLPVYAQMPLTAVSGHGSWLVDEQGAPAPAMETIPEEITNA